LKIFKFIDDLSNLSRWSQAYCAKNESVLEHTGFVALYSLSICYKYKIHPDQVLIKALVHDVDEVITGDIPTPTKYANPKILSEIRKLEDDAAKLISDELFEGKIFKKWKDSKDLNTDSGCIIAIADCAGVVYKIWQEVNVGNKSFLQFIVNIERALYSLYDNVKPIYRDEIKILLRLLGELNENS